MKPDLDPPPGCVWCDCPKCGDWVAGTSWNTTMPIGAEGDPIWFREALELDGHEDCCHHRVPVAVDRIEEAG